MKDLGSRLSSRALAAALALVAALVGCGDAPASPPLTSFAGFDGCRAGADSVVAFLQRTLDQLGDAELHEAGRLAPEFDEGVAALLLRAQEVHCTEQGFTDAIIARVAELDSGGPAGDLLIATVRDRGLGSLDAARGGPIRLGAG